MTPQEEYRASVEQLEETVTQLVLLAKSFRRLEQELWSEEELQDAGQP
jgi:hypothetical protein